MWHWMLVSSAAPHCKGVLFVLHPSFCFPRVNLHVLRRGGAFSHLGARAARDVPGRAGLAVEEELSKNLPRGQFHVLDHALLNSQHV